MTGQPSLFFLYHPQSQKSQTSKADSQCIQQNQTSSDTNNAMDVNVARDAYGQVVFEDTGNAVACFGCDAPLLWRPSSGVMNHKRRRGDTDCTVTHVHETGGAWIHDEDAVLDAVHLACTPEVWTVEAAMVCLVASGAVALLLNCASCPIWADATTVRFPSDSLTLVANEQPRCVRIYSDGVLHGAIHVVYKELPSTQQCDALQALTPDRWYVVHATDVIAAARSSRREGDRESAVTVVPIAVCSAAVCKDCTERRRKAYQQLKARLHRAEDDRAAWQKTIAAMNAEAADGAVLRRDVDLKRRVQRLRAESAAEALDDDILAAGRYAGVALSVLVKHDVDYVLRVARGCSDELPSLVRRARTLTRGLCMICGNEMDHMSRNRAPLCETCALVQKCDDVTQL